MIVSGTLYFIEKGKDWVACFGAKEELVKEYEKIMKGKELSVMVYKDGYKMIDDFATLTIDHKRVTYKYLEDNEMIGKINREEND